MDKNMELASLTWRVTPDMVCIIDRDGRFVAVNPAWHNTLGWTREEMLGHPFTDFLHEEDYDRTMAVFENLKDGQPILRFENRYKTKSGDFVWMSWVAVPEEDAFYCTVRDVTEDKARVETIERQSAEAELREQFLAVLGHDLRNPLAAIGSGTRILRRRLDDEFTTEVLDNMRGSVRRMSELIDNLMDLARVRLGGGISAEKVTSDKLGEDLDQVIDEIAMSSPKADIQVDCSIDRTVICDPPRIGQLLSNLLANSVTHGDLDRPIEVKINTTDTELSIHVANYGDEIPDAIKDNLFRPYHRGMEQGTHRGLGLGLYISSEIAKAHNGTLSAESEDGRTTFTFTMPL